MPKVSVIIPCYNQEDYLEDALSSLRGEYKDFEVIVVNDGSPNFGADEKIQSVISSFSDINIKYINQENQGVSAARNNAIKEAQGKYILPLDADDMTVNAYLKEASEILDNNEKIGIVYCNAEFFGEKQGEWKLPKATLINMLSQNRIFCTSMYRKSDWEKVGGYKTEMDEGCEDWDFWLSLFEIGLIAFKIDKLYFRYRQLPKSRTHYALEFKNYVSIRKKLIKFHKKSYMKYNLLVLIPLGLRILLKGLKCQK
ncbi:glycosyltransferase family 2 protein [bacterium]|nr:glycosyltransferase family 2 protein [bacterium]